MGTVEGRQGSFLWLHYQKYLIIKSLFFNFSFFDG